MDKFLKYTTGLMATHKDKPDTPPQLVKVAYYQRPDGLIRLSAESGHNMADLPYKKTISRADFDARPTHAYEDVVEARWALDQLGFEID